MLKFENQCLSEGEGGDNLKLFLRFVIHDEEITFVLVGFEFVIGSC